MSNMKKAIQYVSYAGAMLMFCMLFMMLGRKDAQGMSILEMYLWAQGGAVAETLRNWGTGLGIVASVFATVAFVVPNSEYADEKRRKFYRSCPAVIALICWGTAILGNLFPNTQTLNFIYGRFNVQTPVSTLQLAPGQTVTLNNVTYQIK